MSEKEKKKLFTVQSPYADYAEDNDRISEQMESNAGEEIKPDKQAIIRTVLTAVALVAVFAVMTLLVSAVGSCIGGPAAQ